MRGIFVPWTHVFSACTAPGTSPYVQLLLDILERGTPPLTEEDAFFLAKLATGFHLIVAIPRPGRRIDPGLLGPEIQTAIGIGAVEAAPLVKRLGFDAEGLQLCPAVFGDSLELAAAVRPELKEILSLYRDAHREHATRALAAFTTAYRKWVTGRLVPSATREGRKDPALAALFEWKTRFVSEILMTRTVGGAQAMREFAKAAKRKNKTHHIQAEEAGGGRLELATIFRDFLVSDENRKPGTQYFWGRDGKIHRNSLLDVDRYGAQREREQRLNTAGARAEDFISDGPAGEECDPVAAAMRAEEASRAARLDRSLRESAVATRPGFAAARAYLRGDYRSVRAAADAGGVTQKAVRVAIASIKREAHRIELEKSEKS